MRYAILILMMTGALLCACGGADGEDSDVSSGPADPEAFFSEVDNDLYRMSCREVVCRQGADVSRSTYDTQGPLGTAHGVTCTWSCVSYQSQKQNVYIDFNRFTGECFDTKYISQEAADSYDCEEG